MKHASSFNRILVTIIALVLVVGFATLISAYTHPSLPPTNSNNVMAPINVGPLTQLKTGPLSTAIGAPTGLFTNLFAVDLSSGVKGIWVGPVGLTIFDGTPAVAGRVLTQNSNGSVQWSAAAGGLPTGQNNQTLRHNGTGWVATGSVEVGSGGEVWMATLGHMPNVGPDKEEVCAEADGKLVLCSPDELYQGGGGVLQPIHDWRDVPEPSGVTAGQFSTPAFIAYMELYQDNVINTCSDFLNYYNFTPLNNDAQNVRSRISSTDQWTTGSCLAFCFGTNPACMSYGGQNQAYKLVPYNTPIPDSVLGAQYFFYPWDSSNLFHFEAYRQQ